MIICAHIFCAQEDFRILAKRQVSLVNMSATDSRLTSQKILKILIKKRNYDNHGLFLNWIRIFEYLKYLNIWNKMKRFKYEWILRCEYEPPSISAATPQNGQFLLFLILFLMLMQLFKTVFAFCQYLILVLMISLWILGFLISTLESDSFKLAANLWGLNVP